MPTVHQFGPFRLDGDATILFLGTEPTNLGPRAVALLRILLERSGAPVSKDALIEGAWSGLAVEDSNLTVQIASIRKVLAAAPGGERWIETLPRRGYRYIGPTSSAAGISVESQPSAADAPNPPLPERPSIAVLPFSNISGDPGQDYFADGISEDLITRLSRIRWLFVIGRNSTFAYKSRSMDVKQISLELGIRYVLEGSVRKLGDRLRINVQLTDATSGGHHWAERFDRELTDIFELQDEIARSVAGAIEPHLLAAEGVRSFGRLSDELGAWDMVARALAHFWRMTQADTATAIDILDTAVKKFPAYAAAHSLLAFTLVFAAHMGWENRTDTLPKAQGHAARAVELDDMDPWADLAIGYLAMMHRRTEESIAACRRAVDLNPSSATAHGYLGRALGWAGRDQEAIASLKEAIRLSPHDPQNAIFLANVGMCHYLSGRFVEAVDVLAQASKRRPGFLGLQRLLCASLAQAGRQDEARELLADIRRQQPSLSLEWIRLNVPYQTPELLEQFLDGMRKAGLS